VDEVVQSDARVVTLVPPVQSHCRNRHYQFRSHMLSVSGTISPSASSYLGRRRRRSGPALGRSPLGSGRPSASCSTSHRGPYGTPCVGADLRLVNRLRSSPSAPLATSAPCRRRQPSRYSLYFWSFTWRRRQAVDRAPQLRVEPQPARNPRRSCTSGSLPDYLVRYLFD